MADHRAIGVELAREHFPDNELATEIAAREAIVAEEAAAYAADLYAHVEEQGVLETTHTTTRLREELPRELRAEGSGTGGKADDDDYVHLDNDDLDANFLADLPTIAEAAAERRALMASFETQHCDQSARQLMVAERRASMDRLAAAQQRARHSAHHCNMAAAMGGGGTAPGGEGSGEGNNSVGEGKSARAPVPPPLLRRLRGRRAPPPLG
jgi:hypothetical protein